MPNFKPVALYPGGAIFPGTVGFVGNFPASPKFTPVFNLLGKCPHSRLDSMLELASMREAMGMAREITGTVRHEVMELEAEDVGVPMSLIYLGDCSKVRVWQTRGHSGSRCST
jgi:hypothetical protein